MICIRCASVTSIFLWMQINTFTSDPESGICSFVHNTDFVLTGYGAVVPFTGHAQIAEKRGNGEKR